MSDKPLPIIGNIDKAEVSPADTVIGGFPFPDLDYQEARVMPNYSSSSGNYPSASSNGNGALETAKEGYKALKILKIIFPKNPLLNASAAHAPEVPNMQRTLDSLNAVYPNPRGKNRFSPLLSETVD